MVHIGRLVCVKSSPKRYKIDLIMDGNKKNRNLFSTSMQGGFLVPSNLEIPTIDSVGLISFLLFFRIMSNNDVQHAPSHLLNRGFLEHM